MATKIKTVKENSFYIESNRIVIGDDKFNPLSRVYINLESWENLKQEVDKLIADNKGS